ncbi:class I SAM-dependent methyltransferase [Aeromonas caviae]|uniref:class I SAM-dependent methyltransferase n=1 Tax=Aeromonas caviae TaxID=648 RepID=UPI0024437033|nr:class I SAM-dependent methyltransferase [Aeromonas caviae]
MNMLKRESVIFHARKGGVGIELGVAEGIFSERIMKLGQLSFLYGVDMYAGDRGHDINQYKSAFMRLDKYREKYALLKMKFDEALDMFPDEYFDFIYVDGYAHTGEEEGKTLHDWFPKLKVGGGFCR